MPAYSKTVETARAYYNSTDADTFYATIWGGKDIHIGLYDAPDDSIAEASHRSVERLAALLTLRPTDRVLDIGAGYGGTARYLVETTGCHADCLNLSEIQNQRNRALNREKGLEGRLNVIDGNFEAIPSDDNRYDVVISQDAILHSGNRRKVLQEVHRVLKAGGGFVFTDPMQADNCPPGVLQPVLDRIHLESLGSISFYQQNLAELGFEEVQLLVMTHHLVNHYCRVLQELEKRYAEITQYCRRDYVDRMKIGLGHWIEAGQKGYLAWGYLHFRKQTQIC
ncbi:methyltransferase domain-containing protein [bacterium]|nr:methyltransferase domain-containing protein [bacterium]